MSGALLEINNLRVSFFTKLGEVKAVDDISYSIEKGKTLGIVGESGCGKSVSAYATMGILSYPGRIVGGSIRFNGTELTKLDAEGYANLRGHKIGMIFQEAMTALNPVLTIGFQITEQIQRHLAFTEKDAWDRAVELLQMVGIPSPAKRVHEYPHQLSGGMKQRAMIAMALSCNPELLIADEPTTALDVTIQAQILDLIQSLQQKFHMAVEFITHDLGVISELADNIIVMYAGRVVEYGSNQEIFNNPVHPYTRGLLQSIPRFRNRLETLYAIPGVVPSPFELPQGCVFYNRCAEAKRQCQDGRPTLITIPGTENHTVACFHQDQQKV